MSIFEARRGSPWNQCHVRTGPHVYVVFRNDHSRFGIGIQSASNFVVSREFDNDLIGEGRAARDRKEHNVTFARDLPAHNLYGACGCFCECHDDAHGAILDRITLPLQPIIKPNIAVTKNESPRWIRNPR